MDEITANHELAVVVRDDVVHIDQRIEPGGGDAGPSPTELFVASLAACAGFYARRYLTRYGLPAEGLVVGASYTVSDRPPARITGIELRIQPPATIPEHRRKALIAVAEHCTVHNSIMQPPRIHLSTVS